MKDVKRSSGDIILALFGFKHVIVLLLTMEFYYNVFWNYLYKINIRVTNVALLYTCDSAHISHQQNIWNSVTCDGKGDTKINTIDTALIF